MALTRYFVLRRADGWHITMDGQHMAVCTSSDEAVNKAAGMAHLMGTMGHDADVMLETPGGLELVWTHGVDAYPLRPALDADDPADGRMG